MFTEELLSILVDAGVGTLATGTNPPPFSLFSSSKSQIPGGSGPFLSVTETGGSGPEGTHNSTKMPAYQRPNAQLVVRASTYAVARAMAMAAYAALFPVRNRFVMGCWWRQVIILQEPFDMGLDATSRATCGFNIAVTKRPNAAMS